MMTEGWSTALEGLPLAAFLRNSMWAYPLINAGHLVGVALMVGSIVPLDLRLLGVGRRVPPEPLWRMLVPTAAVGFGLAAVCGVMLFVTRATAYIDSSLFLCKVVFIAGGLANAAMLHASGRWRAFPSRMPWPVRCHAAVSLAVWILVLVLGRFVGYY